MESNEFRSTSILFSKIKEDLSSFDNSGLLDEGRFYSDVKYILNLLGVNWFILQQEILDVDRYKVALPDDFKLLDFAYKCKASKILPDAVIMTQQTFDHYPMLQPGDWHSSQCNDQCCTPPSDCIFNAYEKVIISRSDDLYEYSNPVLLRIGNINTKRHCDKSCVNIYSTSPDTITIQNNHIYTNFEKGVIYLSYYAFPLDEETGLPLIPNNSRVEKCIEDYIKYNIIKNVVTNKDLDVMNLVSLYKNDYKESLGDAVYETKLPTFNNMVGQIRRNRKRLDIYFQLTSNA